MELWTTNAYRICYDDESHLEKIYKDDHDGYVDALVRHVEFFNITPQLAPFVGGVVASMEEMKARGEVDGEAISSIKTALMGPLSGIGDSIFIGCIRIIALGIGLSFALNGNIIGPLLYFLIYNIPAFIVRFGGARLDIILALVIWIRWKNLEWWIKFY